MGMAVIEKTLGFPVRMIGESDMAFMARLRRRLEETGIIKDKPQDTGPHNGR